VRELVVGRRVQTVAYTADRPPVELITALVDESAAKQRVAVCVFPRLCLARDVVQLLLHLRDSESRWNMKRLEDSNGTTAVGLTWKTRGGVKTHAMGFAPLGTMPVTRRAPYTAIALWSGGFENSWNPQEKEDGTKRTVVNLADAAHGIGEETHAELWTGSEHATAALFFDPPDEAKRLYRVAFRLPTDATTAAFQ
jgi:hypothetical protein